MLDLTMSGREALGIKDEQPKRWGGAEHRYWVHRVAEHLRRAGHEVRTEFSIGGGKTIDIVAERDGQRIAYEIETGKSDVAANVRKCLAAGMDQVVVVGTSQRARDALAASLRQHPRVLCLAGAEVCSSFSAAACPT